MSLRSPTLWGCVLLAGWAAPSKAATYVLATVECTANVSQAEADRYYEAMMENLAALKDAKVIERKQLKRVLDERDLALALNPESSDRVYALSGRKLDADEFLVPGICRLGDDYILSLRLISIHDGSTKACAIRKTRVASKFGSQASELMQEVLGPHPLPATTDVSDNAVDAELLSLREECRKAQAERYFPSLWGRAESLRKDAAGKGNAAKVKHYYLSILHLCARAAWPPEGMVFIPGGWVALDTAKGPRKLWVEPFFMDRCEVTVGQYSEFLRERGKTGEGLATLRQYTPITRGQESFDREELPVTGISWNAANAFAAWRGKRLPTMLQWTRVACGDQDNVYPCGSVEAAKRCNLKGSEYATGALAPVDKPGDDASPLGVLGMTGNVREWTSTWYAQDAFASGSDDAPEEPARGTMKIVKGGSWRTALDQAKCQSSEKFKAGEAMDDLGFRCVLPFLLPVEGKAEPTTRKGP